MARGDRSVTTAVPHQSLALHWAAGVLDVKGVFLPIIRNGIILGAQVHCRCSKDVGERLAKVLGGVYTGARWAISPADQEAVLSKIQPYMTDRKRLARIASILGLRRTIVQGQPMSDDVRAWRKRLAERLGR